MGSVVLTLIRSQQNAADQKKGKAEAESDLSHSAVKAGPFTMSSSGAATQDDPDRTKGSYNQTMGSAKETVGNIFGAQGLKNEGRQQNAEGQGQEAKGQLNDYGSGIAGRVQGTLGGAASGLMGDKSEQARYQEMHDKSKTQQRGAEHDIQKQADA